MIPFGTTADTMKIKFTPEKTNCKMQVTVSIIGCFQSACECVVAILILTNSFIHFDC